jgi:hypothetical protein
VPKANTNPTTSPATPPRETTSVKDRAAARRDRLIAAVANVVRLDDYRPPAPPTKGQQDTELLDLMRETAALLGITLPSMRGRP